jgi:hypothetical protein
MGNSNSTSEDSAKERCSIKIVNPNLNAHVEDDMILRDTNPIITEELSEDVESAYLKGQEEMQNMMRLNEEAVLIETGDTSGRNISANTTVIMPISNIDELIKTKKASIDSKYPNPPSNQIKCDSDGEAIMKCYQEYGSKVPLRCSEFVDAYTACSVRNN